MTILKKMSIGLTDIRRIVINDKGTAPDAGTSI